VSAPALDEIDLSDPELYATGDPHAVWAHLRQHEPVFFQKHAYGPGFWAITTYTDIVRLSSDHSLSSAGGRSTTSAAAAPDAAIADILVCTDPPKHTKLRALVNKAFTPRVVAGLEPYVTTVVDRLVDEIADRGECDFAQDFAAMIPYTVICELLGVPETDRPSLAHAVGSFMESRAHINEPRRNDIELARYFLDLANERRARPRDDLMSRLVAAEIDGERLSDPDILALAMLLFIAGSETTMNSMSGGLLALIEHPDQRALLTDDPALWPSAIEEILRWASPVLNGMVRTATEPIDVRGVRIDPGQKVTLWYPSANRDEDHFPRADTFDVTRTPNDHVAFGAGWHFCLGASLARLELRIALPRFLAAFPEIEICGNVTRLRSNVSYAIEQLPVSCRTRGAR
jgi:cytochrome P450